MATAEKRLSLYEFEIYDLLSLIRSGGYSQDPAFIPLDCRLTDEELTALPGEKSVLKIVSAKLVVPNSRSVGSASSTTLSITKHHPIRPAERMKAA